MEGWDNRNNDDDKCAKMPIFSKIRKLNKFVCMLFIQINYNNDPCSIMKQIKLAHQKKN